MPCIRGLSVFRDVTQRNPERGALRDIPKDGCEGDYQLAACNDFGYLQSVSRILDFRRQFQPADRGETASGTASRKSQRAAFYKKGSRIYLNKMLNEGYCPYVSGIPTV